MVNFPDLSSLDEKFTRKYSLIWDTPKEIILVKDITEVDLVNYNLVIVIGNAKNPINTHIQSGWDLKIMTSTDEEKPLDTSLSKIYEDTMAFSAGTRLSKINLEPAISTGRASIIFDHDSDSNDVSDEILFVVYIVNYTPKESFFDIKLPVADDCDCDLSALTLYCKSTSIC